MEKGGSAHKSFQLKHIISIQKKVKSLGGLQKNTFCEFQKEGKRSPEVENFLGIYNSFCEGFI